MAGDDTTPDPLFKNVLRRPRSATSAYYTERPRKEEPDGGDPLSGSSVSNASVSPPATATEKETARPSSTGAYSTNKSGHAGNNGGESPSKVKKATAGFFPNKAHVTDALRSILAGLDASDPVLVYQKQMPPSDRCKGQNRLLMSCKCESRRAAFASVFTEAEMTLVHRPAEPPPLKAEEDDDEQGNRQRSAVHGLAVQAYDCDGRAYELSLKYLSCNTAYRIIGPDYTVFLKNNGLLVSGGGVAPKRSRQRKKRRRSSLLADEEQPAVRDAAGDVQMELWAFRSPKLSVGEKDQPHGALGLLLLHRRGGEAGVGQVRAGGAAATTTEVAEPREVVVVEDDAAAGNKLGDAVTRSTRDDMPLLSPVERLIASFLSYDDHHSHTANINDNGEADA